jgi:hypothetical protein
MFIADLPPVSTDCGLAIEHLPEKVVGDLLKISQWLVEQGQVYQHLQSYGTARATMLSKTLQGYVFNLFGHSYEITYI